MAGTNFTIFQFRKLDLFWRSHCFFIFFMQLYDFWGTLLCNSKWHNILLYMLRSSWACLIIWYEDCINCNRQIECSEFFHLNEQNSTLYKYNKNWYKSNMVMLLQHTFELVNFVRTNCTMTLLIDLSKNLETLITLLELQFCRVQVVLQNEPLEISQ